jgi:hypothetical protein
MQPTLRLGEGDYADGARMPSAETGWASCWRAEPEMDAPVGDSAPERCE